MRTAVEQLREEHEASERRAVGWLGSSAPRIATGAAGTKGGKYCERDCWSCRANDSDSGIGG